LVQQTQNGGKLLKHHVEEIKIFKPIPGSYFEQSSDDIWLKVCACIRAVTADVDKSKIKGIGFDATCSLVLLDKNNDPLTASPTKRSDQNIIMWMDHRAQEEADFINSLNHDVLKYVGGKVSLEMEIPKLLWLKKNLNADSFSKIHHAFDLPDFLTFKATGKVSRSVCSLTCKWNYDAVKNEFPRDFFKSIGLDELCENNFQKIGNEILAPGQLVGTLSEEAAKAMNLPTGIFVGASMIDAHAGALGLIGSDSKDLGELDVTSKLVIIAGTSTCHMSITEDFLFAPGIWGPYKNALIPDFFLHEGGQSAAGILIDHMLTTHPDYDELKLKIGDQNMHDHLYTEIMSQAEAENFSSFHDLTRNFHIYPDFHGNRSPIADSSLRGMISGLSMHDSIYVYYLAIIQALSYSTRHIIETLYASGRKKFEAILICGGLSKNKLFVQTNADVCGIPVLLSSETESVLGGAAMLGATASGSFPNLLTAISQLSNEAFTIEPDSKSFDFHSRKYQVYLKMLEHQNEYKKIMNN
jgi:FGGY-family pentulose kinase